jgi:hypothetical protein
LKGGLEAEGRTGPVNYFPWYYPYVKACQRSPGHKLWELMATPAPAVNNRLGVIYTNMINLVWDAEAEAAQRLPKA